MTETAVTAPSPQRILSTALQLFARKGYDACSVREICEAAGITKPTLYHFFGSKEGVYRALVEGTLVAFRQDVVQALEGPGTSRERLRRVARAYFSVAREKREQTRFIFALIHNPPSSAPPTDIPAFYEDVVRLVAADVEDGVRSGEFAPGDLEVRMLVLMGALAEAVCGSLIVGRPDLTPELADRLVDTVADGWRK